VHCEASAAVSLMAVQHSAEGLNQGIPVFDIQVSF